MFKKKTHSSISSLIRVLFTILLISFALGTSACSSGGESTSASGSAQ